MTIDGVLSRAVVFDRTARRAHVEITFARTIPVWRSRPEQLDVRSTVMLKLAPRRHLPIRGSGFLIRRSVPEISGWLGAGSLGRIRLTGRSESISFDSASELCATVSGLTGCANHCPSA